MREPKLAGQHRLNAVVSKPGDITPITLFYVVNNDPSYYLPPRRLIVRPGQKIVDTIFGKVVIEENGEASDRSLGG